VKTNLKLAKLWLDRKEYSRLSKVHFYHFHQIIYLTPHQLIRDLHNATSASSDGDDQSQRGTQLLEVYALEIQMYNETRNYKKLKVCTMPGHASLSLLTDDAGDL
jgi:COP9 signalosome complex subunit 2